MPELSDDMYCSQQIIVPPMFPYILRQYAKAAIRSQPTDLLRWSTAYFRCLSLNLPPPVKPRLEYPLPKDYDGITPGWLKALLFQLINNSHADFKVLWDRWIGACQNHITLIKILCLSGFNDPMAIPLYRFIASCVGFLNENLTQTMIMFCEVVTEEPEGGSAMIPVEIFIDVYTFLASIDASKDQVLLNRYFTDELLALLEKKEEKIAEIKEEKIKKLEKVKSLVSEVSEEEIKIDEDRKDAISCPDLIEDAGVAPDDSSSEEDQAEVQCSQTTIVDDKERYAAATGKTSEEIDAERAAAAQRRHEYAEGEDDLTDDISLGSAAVLGLASSTTEAVPAPEPGDSESEKVAEESAPLSVTGGDEVVETVEQSQDVAPEETEAHAESATSVVSAEPSKGSTTYEKDGDGTEDEEKEEEDVAVKADIDNYLKRQASAEGEGGASEDSDMRKKLEELGDYSRMEGEGEEGGEITMKEKFTVDEVFVEVIPGIGEVVPTDLVEAVIKYMKECAINQQGMVMPRNIRHYSCPPLEP